MSRPNWRDPADYEPLRSADVATLAGEFLRRNPDYQADRERLTGIAAKRELTQAECDEFALAWGVRFRCGPRTLTWTPRALPSVIGVTATPSVLAGASCRADARALSPALGLRMELLSDSVADAALLPFDEDFPIRVAAALRVWRALTGRKPGPDPQALTTHRRLRLVLALRALDGRRTHVSYRQLAEGLFGPLRLRSDADWNSHDVRDRTIRLARLGVELSRGGYRRLLRYPNRCLR